MESTGGGLQIWSEPNLNSPN